MSEEENSQKEDEQEEVRTVFISGLPQDVRDREIYLLCRKNAGYEGCVIKVGGKVAVAFATFNTKQQAIDAVEDLKGVQFDPNMPSELRVELAKHNTRGGQKRERERDKEEEDNLFAKKMRTAGATDVSNGSSFGVAPASYNYPETSWNSYAQITPEQILGYANTLYSGYEPSVNAPKPAEQPKRNTIFVANMGANTSEAELREVLERLTGFQRMRFQLLGGNPVCFAEFQDTSLAAQAISVLDGFKLSTSDKPSGLRVEFAKKDMGQPSRFKTPPNPYV